MTTGWWMGRGPALKGWTDRLDVGRVPFSNRCVMDVVQAVFGHLILLLMMLTGIMVAGRLILVDGRGVPAKATVPVQTGFRTRGSGWYAQREEAWRRCPLASGRRSLTMGS